MSLEVKIEALTASVNQLIAVMSAAQQSAPAAPVVQAPPVAAPVAPAPVAPAPVAAAMPALPTFAPAPAPVAAAPVAGAPFSNAQEVMAYTMGAYKAMGPEKGNKIQGILQSMGIANLNDLKPEQYGPFYQAVEALKVS
jgi:hypothetical protein